MQSVSNTRAARQRLRFVVFVAALVIGVSGFATTASAQSMVRLNIDFAFMAGTNDLPAGAYEFEAVPGSVVVRSRSGKAASFMMPVITRLGRHDADADPELIFDKVDGKLHLSELWLPNADGYLLTTTKGDHEHRVIGGSRPHK